MDKPELRAWLEENAHFGRHTLARALHCSGSHVSTLCLQLGVDMTSLKRARGYGRNERAPGEPSEPPALSPPPAPRGSVSQEPDERDLECRLKAKDAELRRLTGERDILMADLGRSREFFDEVLAALDVIKPLPLKYKPPARRAEKPSASMVMAMSDPHTGEVVNSAQTAGWGEYNWSIQEERVQRFTADALSYLETQRAAYRIDTLHIPVLGDMVSGDIHLELLVTNEFPSPVQVVRASHLYGEQIAALAPHAERVIIDIVTDSNHGRLSRKPQFKEGGTNTHDFTVAEFIKQILSAHANVEVNIHVASKSLVEIAGFGFLLEHGDAYKAWNQIPHYGIQRGIRSEAWRRMGHEGLEFDYVMMGHWHQPFSIEGGRVLGVGTPKGTCEFSLKQGYVTEASQTAFLVGKHGVFARTDFSLEGKG